MTICTRRQVLGATMATGATLALATAPRKLLAADEAGAIQGFRRLTPPAPPPEFRFTLADGSMRSLADYAGRGVVLNLWATWCSPCVAEMPALDQLAGLLGGSTIAVLPLSSDRMGAPVVQAFYQSHRIAHLPVLLDPHGAAVMAFAAPGIPTTLLISPAGLVLGRVEGAVDWSTPNNVAAIRRLLAPVAAPVAAVKQI